MWQLEQAVVVLTLRSSRAVLFLVNDLIPSIRRCWTACDSAETLGLIVQHLLVPLPLVLVSRRVATQAVEAAVGSTLVVAARQTLSVNRNLPRALCQLVYVTAVLAVLDVLAAQSRRLGAQHGAEPARLTPLELLLLAADCNPTRSH
jgi:hypothetical protein